MNKDVPVSLMLSIGIMLIQVLSLAIFIGGIWAYRFKFKWFRGCEPLRCATISEQRLLAIYYPKETFERAVRQHSGPYRKGGTMADWTGMDLIGDLPVFLPVEAKEFLKAQGDNQIEVVCGKKRAYVIRLNDGYAIEDFAPSVEMFARIRAQWDFGIPGPRIDDPATLILGQRRTSKKERRLAAYEIYTDMPDVRRVLGSIAVVLTLLMFWAMASDFLGSNPGWYILGTLIAIAGFVPMTLEKHRPRETVNLVQGVYRRNPEGSQIRVGERSFVLMKPVKMLVEQYLEEGQTIIAHVQTDETWVLHIEGLPDAYPEWRFQDHETPNSNLIMFCLLAASALLAYACYPTADRSHAQAWVHYASGGLCIAYGINMLRRIRQRRPRAKDTQASTAAQMTLSKQDEIAQ